MKHFMIAAIVCILLVTSASTALSQTGFVMPRVGYIWDFPRDYSNHPDYEMDWWYYTGHLLPVGADSTDEKQWIHYQITFYRASVMEKDVSTLYFGHFAMSGDNKLFRFQDQIATGELGEAGAENEAFHVWLGDWRAYSLEGHQQILEAYHPKIGGLRLKMVPQMAPVLHGSLGFSLKSKMKEQASYYYSEPVLETTGWYTPPNDDPSQPRKSIPIRGTSWKDHEFGTLNLTSEEFAWDWWGLHLPGGDILVIYLLHNEEKVTSDESEGTFISKDGSKTRILLEDIHVETLGTWTSPHSQTTYPHGWKIHIDDPEINVTVTPILADQELQTETTTGVTYYEGAVRIERQGYEKSTFGFVELVGYHEEQHGKKTTMPGDKTP